MNPLNLPGPQFLLFYAVVFVAVMIALAFLRFSLREPAGEPTPAELKLLPYEVAYLAGGEALATNAAIARLVHDKNLLVDAANRKLSQLGTPAPTTSKLEWEVYSAVDAKEGTLIGHVRDAVEDSLRPIRSRLQQLGLVVVDSRAWFAQYVPLILALLVPAFGLLKILVGLSRDKPVMLLIVFCVASTFIAVATLGRAVHRSRRGDRALAALKEVDAAMQYQASRRLDELGGDDLVLALGLFGLGVLSTGPLADLKLALRPPANSSSCGSGCGSGCGGGGCGGGCGGGGCGGCGG